MIILRGPYSENPKNSINVLVIHQWGPLTDSQYLFHSTMQVSDPTRVNGWKPSSSASRPTTRIQTRVEKYPGPGYLAYIDVWFCQFITSSQLRCPFGIFLSGRILSFFFYLFFESWPVSGCRGTFNDVHQMIKIIVSWVLIFIFFLRY